MEASNAIIIGTIYVCNQMVDVCLIRVPLIHIFLLKSVFGLNMVCDMLDSHMYVSSLVGDSVVVTYVHHAWSIMYMGF